MVMYQTYYAAATQRLHKRLDLNRNAETLLRTYDDFKLGKSDRDALGRMVRGSPGNRRAIADTIDHLAETIVKRPEDADACLKLIHIYTEILKIADEGPEMAGFPLLKLPLEIRHKIYRTYLNSIFSNPANGIVTLGRDASCRCMGYTPPAYEIVRRICPNLALVSHAVHDEFIRYFYSSHAVYFTCGCLMRDILADNRLLSASIVKAKVHWNGPLADAGFVQLKTCKKLRELEIVISKVTTHHLNSREAIMRQHFATNKPPRLCDACGMDEILNLRGLTGVKVTQINQRQAPRRSEDDRAGLTELLRDILTMERDEDDDADSSME